MVAVGPTGPFSGPALVGVERTPASARPAEGTAFGDLLSGAIDEARARDKVSTEASTGFANGDPGVGIHEVMIASEQANISLRYAVSLKNKLVDASRELMNTQV